MKSLQNRVVAEWSNQINADPTGNKRLDESGCGKIGQFLDFDKWS
jgi:hypothetical protein